MSQQFLTERDNLIQVGGSPITLGQKTAANSLPVTWASDQSALTISGTVTANAGTNLNTSLLALESGGNLAAIAAAAVAQGTTAPTKVIVVGGKSNDGTAQYKEIPLGAGARSVIVEGFSGGTAVPISASSLPLPALAATSTKQSDGSQKTQVVDGGGNVISATANALDVNIKTNATTNQSTNVAQINGVTPLMGAGNTGTGSLRVTVASDQAAIATTTTPGQGTPTTTTPSVTDSTSFTLVAANASRKYLLVQNDSSANVLISLSNATLTGIVPTSTNKGIVLIPGASYENPAQYCSTAAITAYQTSGSTINTIVAIEG